MPAGHERLVWIIHRLISVVTMPFKRLGSLRRVGGANAGCGL